MKLMHLVPAAALAVFTPLAAAQNVPAAPATTPHPAAHHATAGAAATAPQSDGEVRRIDKAQGKLTLRHGPLPHLDMPPMTMVFRVADARLLDGLKEGDKVRFHADRVNGVFTVIAVQPAP